MKRVLLAASTLAAFSVASAAAACDAYDQSMAADTPPAALASAPPAASKVPAPALAKTSFTKVTKQATSKRDSPASTSKVAAAPQN